jgi:hypothetical protein
MQPIKVTFVIGQLREEEMLALKNDEIIVSKMILSQDDYSIFRYKEGDQIQVESQNGDRVWCTIHQLEKVEREEGMILIFTLEKINVKA